MKYKYLRAFGAIWLLLILLLGSMEAKSKGNADKLFKQGQAAEEKGEWDKALEFYLQALDIKPTDAGYMLSMRRARFQAGQKHVGAGQKARSEGKLEEALGEFQKALIADPSSSISIQEMKRTQEMIEAEKKQGPGGPAARGLTPV
jgi:general secretion pathway protein D